MINQNTIIESSGKFFFGELKNNESITKWEQSVLKTKGKIETIGSSSPLL